jgi:hypothetical protein
MKYALLFLALLTVTVARADSDLPAGLAFRYAVDEEHGWDFLILEVQQDRSGDFSTFEYVVYAPDGEKVAMTRLGLLRSLDDPRVFVGRLLVNRSWGGRYSLVITSRDEKSGVFRARVYDVQALLASLK